MFGLVFRRRSVRRQLLTGFAGGVAAILLFAPVAAAGVDQQRDEVQRIADELDAIGNRIDQLEEEYSEALDRQDLLAIEITKLQSTVAAQEAELGDLEGKLRDLTISQFTSNGTGSVTPLLSSADQYSLELEREQLTRVALDDGVGDVDEIEAQLAELNQQRRLLADKQQEAADLIATLEAKQREAAELETEYEAKYAAAQAKLGDLIAQEQARRAEAEAEAQRAAWERANNGNNNNGGGGNTGGGNTGGGNTGGGNTGGGNTGGGNTGGGNTGGGNTGGGNTGGGNTGGGNSGGGGTPPPVSGRAGVAVNAAYQQLGVPYKFAASSPGVAFDCSGLTKYAWSQAGVYLPHQSRAQYAATPRVSQAEAQPGDLIFYYSPIGHVGIYIGGGSMIHAPRTGDVVKIVAVSWSKTVGIGRPG